MVTDFPVWSLEDGLAESDWDGWVHLTERLGDRIQLVGDDILVTNPAIIAEAIGRRAGNAALIKVNQIGTVTETLAAMAVCREAGWAQMVSHRSGETEDSFIADLAVASGCGQLEERRSGPRGAGSEIQPADRDRSRRTPTFRTPRRLTVQLVSRLARGRLRAIDGPLLAVLVEDDSIPLRKLVGVRRTPA